MPRTVDKGGRIVSMGSALNRKLAYFLIFSLLVPVLASAQSTEMVSAEKYFANLSASYSKVKDYEANLTITQGKAVSRRQDFVQVTPVPVHQVRRPRKPGDLLRRGEADRVPSHGTGGPGAALQEEDTEPARGDGHEPGSWSPAAQLLHRLPQRAGAGSPGGRLPRNGGQAEAGCPRSPRATAR